MKSSHIPDNPLFYSNTVNLQGSSGNVGAYMFMADALLIPKRDQEIRQHEIAHRILAHHNIGFSTFQLVGYLAGINYALLLALEHVIRKHDAFLHGKKLGEFYVSTKNQRGDEVKSVVNTILERIKYVEGLIDMAWRGFIPVAELLAIDFADGAEKAIWDWKIRQPTLSEKENIENSKKKLKYVKSLINEYPSDFGGYHMNFGSFQNAMLKAWEAYNSIEDEETRKELLQLCSCIMFIDDNNQIQVREPISIILRNASLAQKQGKSVVGNLCAERQYVELMSIKLIHKVRELVLDGIPNEFIKIQELVSAMHQLVNKQSDGDIFPMPIRELSIYSRDASFSFLRFQYTNGGEQEVIINPVFIINAALNDRELSKNTEDPDKNPWPKNLPVDWWRRLILLEAFRQSIKNGSPLTCPLLGWKVAFQAWLLSFQESLNLNLEYVECHENCFIRNWLSNASAWNALSPSKGFCNLEDPEWNSKVLDIAI